MICFSEYLYVKLFEENYILWYIEVLSVIIYEGIFNGEIGNIEEYSCKCLIVVFGVREG